jgi:hypothetical protein
MHRRLDPDHHWIQIEGASMSPFIAPGEQVEVHWSTEVDEFELGDLVLGRGPDKDWILHRIIARDDQHGFWIKGDAAFERELMGSEQIWGRVIRIKSQDKETRVERSVIDRLIASLSKFTLVNNRWFSALCRRMVYWMGWIRRQTL